MSIHAIEYEYYPTLMLGRPRFCCPLDFRDFFGPSVLASDMWLPCRLLVVWWQYVDVAGSAV